MRKGLKYIIAGVLALVLILLIVFGIRGCGVSHKSPERVVEELIEAAVKGKTSRMKDCYGAKKDTPKELQADLDGEVKYFKAHAPESVEMVDCSVIYEEKKYSYVYVIFNLVLTNGEKYPCIRTYMVENQEKGYYILAPSQITDDMKDRAATEYAQFMLQDAYKDYANAYDAFTKKNPGYEEKIAGKLS